MVVRTGSGPGFAGGFMCPVDEDGFGQDCSYSLTNSVALSGKTSSTGFLWNQFFSGAAISFPRKEPVQAYYDADVDAAWGGRMQITNVTFVGFSGPGSAAILTGTDADSIAPLYVKGLRFVDSMPLYMRDPDLIWRTEHDCGVDRDCTGPHNLILYDLDGSLGGGVAQILPHNPPLLAGDSRCSVRGDWNAYACKSTNFTMLYYETLDPDRLSRRIWPVTFAQSRGSTVLAGFMDHLWNGGWTSLLRLNRYGAPIDGDVTITTSGSKPRTLRIDIPRSGSQTTVVKIDYVRPEVPVLTLRSGAIAPRVYTGPPSHTDPHGTWFWDNPARMVVVAVSPGSGHIVSSLTNLVMISLMISVTDAQFWNATTEAFINNIVYSLGNTIDYTTIVIAGSSITSNRRHLMAGATGTIDLACLSPGRGQAP